MNLPTLISYATIVGVFSALAGYHRPMILVAVFLIIYLFNLWILRKRIFVSGVIALIITSLVAIIFVITYLGSIQ